MVVRGDGDTIEHHCTGAGDTDMVAEQQLLFKKITRTLRLMVFVMFEQMVFSSLLYIRRYGCERMDV